MLLLQSATDPSALIPGEGDFPHELCMGTGQIRQLIWL
jgi:hypothetical protein